MAETSNSTTFRLITFFVLLVIAVGGFSYLAYQRFVLGTPMNEPKTAKADQADGISRPVSEPYVGDLAIFEDAKRDENLQISRVIDILGIKENSTVADIGAGSGWFTVRAAKRVGANGTVYANEINQDYLNHISKRAADEKLSNIKTVLGKEDDPLLPANSVDAVLILKTYHEIAQPVRLLKNLRKSLKPNAKIGIIDRNGNGADHGIAIETITKEAAAANLKLVETHDFVKPDGMDYFLVFEVQQ